LDEKLKCPLCPARFDDLDDLAQHLEDKHDARFPEYKIMWTVECVNCGYIYEAKGCPMICPRCGYKLEC
jgi:rubrerythrin